MLFFNHTIHYLDFIMIKIIISVICAFFFTLSQATQEGRLFIVDSSWENDRDYITLCLFQNNKTDCEGFMIFGKDIYIKARNSLENTYYINAGINVFRSKPVMGCTMMANNYCAFPVSNTAISYIKLR